MIDFGTQFDYTK